MKQLFTGLLALGFIVLSAPALGASCWDGNGNCVRDNGVFTGTQVWQDSRDAGRKIRADDHDTHDQALADGIEDALNRKGENSPTTDLDWNSNGITNLRDATDQDEPPNTGQVQNDELNFITAANVAGTDTITLTAAPAIGSYAAGQRFTFVVENDNTGAVTINVNGLGAKALKKHNVLALVAGDLQQNSLATVVYDGTQFQLVSSPQDQSAFADTILDDTSASAVRSTIGVSNFADTTASNTFTTDQTIQDTGSLAALNLERPEVHGDAADIVGIRANGQSSTGATVMYGEIRGYAETDDNGNEDGQWIFRTRRGGTGVARLHIGTGIHTPNATGGDQGADTINVSEIYDDGERVEATKLDTAQATTSGQTKTFTSPFTTTTRAEVMLEGVSLNGGTDTVVVQIGDSGGLETSSYAGTVSRRDGTTAYSGDSFELVDQKAASVVMTGVLTLLHQGSNVWVGVGEVARTDASRVYSSAGSKTLSGAFTQLAVKVNGTPTDSFDAGSVNVRWYGY